ncbi:uncharacterized protein LOC144411745 [Styela clava]
MENWRKFWKYHGGDKRDWRLLTNKHSEQEDGFNCGILVVKAAEAILTGCTTDFNHSTGICKVYRIHFGDLLLEATDVDELAHFCVGCNGRTAPDGGTLWVECDGCERWCHQYCADFAGNEEFFCEHCT